MKDPTSESRAGETPNGGVRSTAFYQDDQGQPLPKSRATHVVIVEYDGDGNSIQRTYGTLKNKSTPKVENKDGGWEPVEGMP